MFKLYSEAEVLADFSQVQFDVNMENCLRLQMTDTCSLKQLYYI